MEKEWEDNGERVLDMIHLLLEIHQALTPSTLVMFLVGILMAFNVVIFSPYGYFGQAHVLGMPDKNRRASKFFFIIATLIP